MNKTLLQTHIDLLNECRRQNKMLEKLIELNIINMNKEEEIPESFWEALVEVKDREINQLKEHVRELQIGHDRYEKLRRLNLREIKELYLKNLRSGENFDKLVDQL
jgi:hypothetical protein